MIYCSQRSVPRKVLLLSGVMRSIHHNCMKHISYVNKRGTFGPCASVRELLMVGLWHLCEAWEVINCRDKLQDVAEFFPLRRMAYSFSLVISYFVTFSLTPSVHRYNPRVWISAWNSIVVTCYGCIALSCIHSTFMFLHLNLAISLCGKPHRSE